MKLVEFLCLGATEVANSARTAHYTRELGLPGATFSANCWCDAIDAGDYVSPTADPAPWYETTRPESADFYGFYASGIQLSPVSSRQVGAGFRHGSILSPARFGGRQLEVSGLMIAASAAGMAYGERWLAEVLRGSACDGDDCVSTDATILPACPGVDYEDADAYFRTLVDVGCIDGPTYTRVIDSECYVQQVSFMLVASQPYLFHPATRCLDEDSLNSYTDLACGLTTPEWMGDGTFKIDITATEDVTNLVIQARIALDGNCPPTDPATSVMPFLTYTIPAMSKGDRLLIDGTKRHAYWYGASYRKALSALPFMTFDGPFAYPDVGPCTTVCLTLTVESGDAEVTVDSYLKEI